jgi:hypothetical protein
VQTSRLFVSGVGVKVEVLIKPDDFESRHIGARPR